MLKIRYFDVWKDDLSDAGLLQQKEVRIWHTTSPQAFKAPYAMFSVKPVQPNTISTSLGSIQPRCN